MENKKAKMENKKLNEIAFYTLLIVILVIIVFTVLGFSLAKIQKTIDSVIAPEFIQEIQSTITCDLQYKDIHYNGICNDEIISAFKELIGYDRRLEMLKFCSSSPYAYKFNPCSVFVARS